MRNYCFFIEIVLFTFLWSSSLLSHFRLWSSHVPETHKTAWHPFIFASEFFPSFTFSFISNIKMMRDGREKRREKKLKTSMKSDHWLAPNKWVQDRNTYTTYFNVYDASIILFFFYIIYTPLEMKTQHKRDVRNEEGGDQYD